MVSFFIFIDLFIFGYAVSWLPHADPLVVASRLSCPAACKILIPQPGIKYLSPALKGRFLTTGPPGKPYPYLSTLCILVFYLHCQRKLSWDKSVKKLFCNMFHTSTYYSAMQCSVFLPRECKNELRIAPNK